MYGYPELTSRNFQTLILMSQKVGKIYLSPFFPRDQRNNIGILINYNKLSKSFSLLPNYKINKLKLNKVNSIIGIFHFVGL